MNRDRFQIFFPDETKEREKPLSLVERAKIFVSNHGFNLRNTSGDSTESGGLESETWRIAKEDAPAKIATLLISYLLFTAISTFYNEAYVTAKSDPAT